MSTASTRASCSRRRPAARCRDSSRPASAPRSCRGSSPTSGVSRRSSCALEPGLVAPRTIAAVWSSRSAASRRCRRVRRSGTQCVRGGAPSRAAARRPSACCVTRRDSPHRRRRSTVDEVRASHVGERSLRPPTKGRPRAALLHPPLALGLRALRRGDGRHVRHLLRHPGGPRAPDVRPARDASVHPARRATSSGSTGRSRSSTRASSIAWSSTSRSAARSRTARTSPRRCSRRLP